MKIIFLGLYGNPGRGVFLCKVFSRTKIGKSKISKCEIAPLSTFFKESAQVKALAVEG